MESRPLPGTARSVTVITGLGFAQGIATVARVLAGFHERSLGCLSGKVGAFVLA